MSELVERVARAIAACNTMGGEEVARAAIAAMREPTEVMKCAGVSRGGGHHSDDGPGGTGAIWSAMIDAALKE